MSRHSEAQKGYKSGSETESRPAFVTTEHLEFLDELRESGVTNMYGSRPYVEREFPDLTTEQAWTIVAYWMKSFGNPLR